MTVTTSPWKSYYLQDFKKHSQSATESEVEISPGWLGLVKIVLNQQAKKDSLINLNYQGEISLLMQHRGPCLNPGITEATPSTEISRNEGVGPLPVPSS